MSAAVAQRGILLNLAAGGVVPVVGGCAGALAGGPEGGLVGIAAGQVVVAAGWRSAELHGIPPEARVPVRPVKGQILRLRGEPGHPLLGRVVGSPEVYIVPRSDGRVLIGATVEEAGFDKRVDPNTIQRLHQAAANIANPNFSPITSSTKPQTG